jgi:pimeloyl-ACP methyl ester carboxylesterase
MSNEKGTQMHASTKSFGRGRAAGVVVIALVALGLGYLHFAGGSDSVSVSSGAHEGQLTLKHCTYANEPADCGTLVVRENRHDRHSRLIALPITRVRAHTSHPGAPIFRLQGGPGITNMDFPEATRFTALHDFVLVGYRGIDGSSRLDCPEVVSAREHSRELISTKSNEAVAAGFRACAQRLRDKGVDLAGYSMPERVDDLELARRELGYGQIDLVSESAGTRTAMIYAWRYPRSIHRSVMVAVNPPGNFLWDAKTTGEQIHRYAALCAETNDCRTRTGDLAASVHSAYERIPSRFWFLPIKKGNVQAAGFFGLMNATTGGGGPLAGPLTLDTLLSADQGDGSGAWLLSVAAQLMFPRAQVWGDVASIARSDAAYAKRFFAAKADRGSVIGSPGTDLVWAGGKLVDAWPANPDENEYSRVQDSSVETLLIGGALDFATPPQIATRELLPHLTNGHEVVLPKLGHADDFWAYEPAASTRLIDTFLDKGSVDTSLYTDNHLDFTPSVTHGTVAEIVVAVFLGFATAMALSVLWIAVRLRRRAMFGPKGSVIARALLPIVLGFGGWCLGVMIVLVAFPTVPITDEVLAVVSIAPPVALAVYAGWFRTAALGSVAAFTALTTATFGAWLGFHVPSSPGLGAVTAIVAATLAANLGLIALDIAAPATATAGEPHPETLPGPA